MDCGEEASSLAHQLVDPDGSTRADQRFPELNRQCLEFLEKIKGQFGERSKLSAVIHDTLGQFSAGNVSKKEAYFVIYDQLGSNDDLKGSLEAILQHKDARWNTQDFQRDAANTAMVSQTHPQYLEPQHRPSLPLPPLSWSVVNYAQPMQRPQSSISPELLYDRLVAHPSHQGLPAHLDLHGTFDESYVHQEPQQPTYPQPALSNQHFGTFSHTPSISPIPQPSAAYPSYGQRMWPASPHMQPVILSPYVGFSQGSHLNSQDHEMGIPSPGSFSLNAAWTKAQYDNLLSLPHPMHRRHQNASPGSVKQQSTPQQVLPLHSSMHTTWSGLGTPTSPSPGQPLLEGLPLKESVEHESQLYHMNKANEEPANEAEQMVQKTLANVSMPVLSSGFSATSTGRQPGTKTFRSKGHFLHGICGKAFTTRNAVKRHHWGAKLDDIHTTTGCWARNGRPKIDWDDHPSCRNNTPKQRVIQRTPPQTPQVALNVPIAPSMIPRRQSTLAGFPTLEALPQMVVESLHSTPPTPQFPVQGEILQYHTSKLPGQGPRKDLDTLLTAVAYASKIDAPAPQAWNDSLVPRLHAQVTSTEFDHRGEPASPNATNTTQQHFLNSSDHDLRHHSLAQAISSNEQRSGIPSSELVLKAASSPETTKSDIATKTRDETGENEEAQYKLFAVRLANPQNTSPYGTQKESRASQPSGVIKKKLRNGRLDRTLGLVKRESNTMDGEMSTEAGL